jgi:hypothetical protein
MNGGRTSKDSMDSPPAWFLLEFLYPVDQHNRNSGARCRAADAINPVLTNGPDR